MPGAEEVRAAQRRAWAALSRSWEKWDAIIMDQLAPVGAAMIEALAVPEDGRHLEVAAGTGEPGLTVAASRPRARVVLTDLAPEMLAVAERRAAAQGIGNVETAVCSADALPYPDASFDTVSVRFGFMFFPDLPKATAELVRVLAPGGRLCGSVWVAPDQNPWTGLVVDAIRAETDVPPPDPSGPHMFRCAAPGAVTSLYEGAGLRDVREWDVELALRAESPEEYWELISEHVSLAAAALRELDPPARERIRTRVLAELQAYEVGGRVRVPGLARCILGVKPG
jgi:SAM-dependent methyltransferase